MAALRDEMLIHHTYIAIYYTNNVLSFRRILCMNYFIKKKKMESIIIRKKKYFKKRENDRHRVLLLIFDDIAHLHKSDKIESH